MHDIVVIGARCAGSPTAMLLARKGYRVLLLDKATFPNDTISTHIVWQTGVATLQRWKLLEKLLATGCPRIPQVHFDVGPLAFAGSAPSADGIDYALAPRRTVLDKLLLDAAAETGVEIREDFAVDELVTAGDQVTGVRGHAGGGARVTESARLVIGADGLHSIVARTMEAREYEARLAQTCWYYAYYSGVPTQGIELYSRVGSAFGLIPTHDSLVCVPVVRPHTRFHEFRADIERQFLETTANAPDVGVRLRAGSRESRFVGTADVPNFFRKPYGLGWALVGDAGYHKDPMTAQGISDAFRDAELLADAVHAGLSGSTPLMFALADYERRRNEAAMPMYQFTGQLAAMDAPPLPMQQLFAALTQNPVECNRFFGLFAGTVPIPEFLAPENIARITGDAMV